MNEQIQKIVDQVNIKHEVGDNCRMVSDQELEKFALLIAQECAKVCKDHKEMYAMLNETAVDDPTFAAMTTAASVCAADIEKIFGV